MHMYTILGSLQKEQTLNCSQDFHINFILTLIFLNFSKVLLAQVKCYHLSPYILYDSYFYTNHHTSGLFYLACWISSMLSIQLWDCTQFRQLSIANIKTIILSFCVTIKNFLTFLTVTKICKKKKKGGASLRFPWECSNLTKTSLNVSKKLSKVCP